MKLQHKISRRNLVINAVTLITASSIAAYSFAAPDYDRIRRDINVMIGIVKSSFDNNEDCHNCNVRVTGHYLAEQGIVFNVNPSGRHNRVFGMESGPHHIEVFAEGMAAIPGMVEEILAEVQFDLDYEDFRALQIITDGSDWSSISREVEHGLREVRQELRKAHSELRERQRALREIEIEAIHAEENEMEDLVSREAEIETEIEKLAQAEEKIRGSMNKRIEKRTQALEARHAEREEQKRQHFEKIETLVLNTFCDYGNTMRSIPDDERISIVVQKEDESSNIYVFKQSELASCDSTRTDVRKHALSYAF